MQVLWEKACPWLRVLVLLLVSFTLSSLGKEELGLFSSVGLAKPAHFIGFLILGAFLFRALNGSYGGVQELSSRAVWGMLVLSIGWAIFDEWHQSLVPGRGDGGLGDILLDTLGALASLIWPVGTKLTADLRHYAAGPWPGNYWRDDSSVTD